MHLVPWHTWFLHSHCYTFSFSHEAENYKETNLLIRTGGSPPQSQQGHALAKERTLLWGTAGTVWLQLRCSCTAHLQVGPLDPPDAAGRVPPGLLGSEGQLIPGQLVGSCAFYLLGHCFQPAQLLFDFWPFEQKTAMKRNKQNFIQGAVVLFIF